MTFLKRFFIIVLLFLIIFEPPIFPFNPIHLVGSISILYLLINYHTVRKIKRIREIIYLEYTLLIIGTLIALIGVLNDNGIQHSLSYFYWFLYTIPFSLMIFLLMKKGNRDYTWLIENLVYAGLLQAFFAVMAFVNSTAKSLFVRMLINYGYGDIIYELESIRLFGLASELTFSTPAVLAVLAVLAIFLGYRKNNLFFIASPILLFSGIINARNSIIIFTLGSAIILIFIAKKSFIKMIIVMIISSILLLALYTITIPILKQEFPITYFWIKDGFEELNLFFRGNFNQGYFSYLLRKEKYVMPDNVLNLLFGTGIYILNANKYGFNTDIGFVNDVWLGGVIYTIAINVLFLSLIDSLIKTLKLKDSFPVYLLVFLTLGLYSLNIKGHAFSKNNYTTVFWILIVFLMCWRYENVDRAK